MSISSIPTAYKGTAFGDPALARIPQPTQSEVAATRKKDDIEFKGTAFGDPAVAGPSPTIDQLNSRIGPSYITDISDAAKQLQIKQQLTTQSLSQANKSPQGVLGLLGG